MPVRFVANSVRITANSVLLRPAKSRGSGGAATGDAGFGSGVDGVDGSLMGLVRGQSRFGLLKLGLKRLGDRRPKFLS